MPCGKCGGSHMFIRSVLGSCSREAFNHDNTVWLFYALCVAQYHYGDAGATTYIKKLGDSTQAKPVLREHYMKSFAWYSQTMDSAQRIACDRIASSPNAHKLVLEMAKASTALYNIPDNVGAANRLAAAHQPWRPAGGRSGDSV